MSSALLILLTCLLFSAQGQVANPTICLPPCWECQSGAINQCTSCILNYVLSNNSCLLSSCQVLNCQDCALFQSTTCIQCMPSFMLINNACVCQGGLIASLSGTPLAACTCPSNGTNCVSCLIPGCLSCINSTSCQTCANNYSLRGGGCYFCNVSNCLTCSTQNFCGVCANNLTVSTYGTCVSCPMGPGCIGCDSAGQCVCQSGYSLAYNSSSQAMYCKPCQAPNCAICSSSNSSYCTTCSFGYQLPYGSGTCVVIGSNVINCGSTCLQCTNGGMCQACPPPKNLFTCNQETIPYCLSYTTNTPSLCNSCNSQFTMSSNRLSCIYSGNQFCQGGTFNGKCTNCTSYYTLINSTCVPCQAGPFCLTCGNSLATISTCLNCMNGFYLSNGQCLPCQPYQSSCWTEFSYPYSSLVGMYLYNVIDNNQQTITWCPASCLLCNPTTFYCSTCQPGFYVSTYLGVCIQCSSNCLTCLASSPTTCLSCSAPDFLQPNGTSCIPCRWPCMACNTSSSFSFCLKCSLGYSLSNGTCFPNTCSTTNCMICNNAACVQCLPGYFIMNGSCVPGVLECNSTAATSPIICLSCYPGSFVDYASSLCVPCPENCFSCTRASSCQQCLDGYFLSGNAQMICAPQCQPPCMTCVVGDPISCTSCIAGYVFVNGTCQLSNCSLSQSCDYCPLGYTINSSMMCAPCTIPSCVSCNPAFSGCTGCLQGYYLSNGSMLCAPCATNCLKCTRSDDCLLCALGTTKTMYGSANGTWSGVCVSCQAPCASCMGHPQICFSCTAGYFLYGTQCVTNTYFLGQILAVGSTPQVIANYQAILSAVLSAVGVTASQFFPTGAVDGLGFTFMVSSTNCPSNTTSCLQGGVTNLTQAFQGTIGNLTFLNTSFTYQTASSSSPTIGSSQCQSPCLTCTYPGGNECLSCARGLVAQAGTCLSAFCPFLNCMTCTTINGVQSCSRCLPTFLLVNGSCVCPDNYTASAFNIPTAVCVCALPNGNCINCNITNCEVCASNSTCQTCASGYNVTAQGLCFGCNITNCVSCQVSGVCSQCQTNYTVSAYGTCVSCSNITNCVQCLLNNICAVCQQGYTLTYSMVNNATQTTCILCTIPGCLSCSQSNVCSNCSYPYVLANNSCQPPSFQCELPCASCNYTSQNQSNTCQFCQSPAYSIYPVNGSCFICQQPFCSQCDPTNTSICLYCEYGFTLSPNGSCTGQLGCTNFSSNGTCTSCQPLYALDAGQGLCLACQVAQGCLSCDVTNLTACTGCISGMFLSNASCQPCPPLCLSCSNSTSCLSYSSSVVVINNQVVIGTCLPPCHCNSSNPYVCIYCDPGYFLSNSSTCQPCLSSSQCSVCNSSNPAQCLSCPSNAALVNGSLGFAVCAYCNQNCLFCQGVNNCLVCVTGFTLSNGTCVARTGCSQYCYLCSTAGTCLQCYPGYFANGPTCLPAIPGCVAHYSLDPSICLSCSPGTVLNPATGWCSLCPQLCFSCSVAGVCTQCYEGYYLSGDPTVPCAPNCLYPCISCSLTNPSVCNSCGGGYRFNQLLATNCEPVTNCSNGCLVCPMSFMLSNSSTCQACSANCSTCFPSSPAFCLSCPVGFYVSTGNQCLPCMAGCAQCTSTNLCLQCANGYVGEVVYFAFATLPPVTSCPACQSPCQTCFARVNYCTSCIDNYTWLAGKCVNNNAYLLQLGLNTTYANFLQNYQAMLNALVGAVAPQSMLNFGLISPFQLSLNSTLTYAALISSSCSPATLCSQTEYTSLEQLLNNGSLAGVPLTSFNLTATFNYMNSNSSAACPPLCTSCNSTTGVCTACSQGYQVSQGVCVVQNCSVQYCQRCSNNTCLQCNNKFILTNNTCVCQVGWQVVPVNSPNAQCECNPSSAAQSAGATLSQVDFCINCIVRNCLQCSNSTTCTNCAAPYTLNALGLCVICNIPDCLQCSQDNFCTQCAGALTVSAVGDQCISCQVSNCLACSSAFSCLACMAGYQMNLDGSACVSCQVPNCVLCQGNGLCGLCAPGYSLVNSTCQLSACMFPCQACQSNSSILCSSCVSPPFNAVPNSGSCFTCQAPNCFSCAFSSPSVCTGCSQGFTLNNGSCQPTCIQAQCLSCSTVNSSICTSCSSGYFLANSACSACPAGCASCLSASVCSTCIQGFYLSNLTCSKCPSYCQSCSTTGSCTALLSSNKNGNALIVVDGAVVLARCYRGCVSCSSNNPSVCLECNSGLFLSSGVCVPCAPASNCKTCNSSNSAQCLTCFPNTFLNQNNACTMCQSPCLTCSPSSTSTCLTCPKGYLLQNGQCLQNQCPLLCSTCTTSTFCTQCISGFVPVNGVCTPCLAGCSQCSTDAPGVCLTCASGTYLDPSSGTCLGCSPNCLSCLPAGCTQCRDGFYLTESLSCGPNCVSPCATCSSTDPNNCLTCELGYSFNSSALQNCQADLSCNSDLSCTGCPLGFVLSNQACLQCSNSQCARCQPGSLSACISCYSGFYLDGIQCLSCPSGCQTCLSSTICLACADSFTSIVEASQGSPVQCVACSSPCLTCDGSPRKCLTCQSGYTLVKAKCVSNFNFGFSCTLGVDNPTFYQNYVAFLKVLSGNVGEDYGSVAINSIGVGSTVVGGTVTTAASPQTATSQSQYNNLQGSLNQNSNIAGMQVIKSSVTANGGNPDDTGSSSSASSTQTWVIVVAIVVPLGVLLIVGIGVFLYCRKKKQSEAETELSMEREIGNSEKTPNQMEMSDLKTPIY